jgi:hypothetical protein
MPRAELQLSPPGSVLMSIMVPPLYRKACESPLALDEYPTTWPLLLIPVANEYGSVPMAPKSIMVPPLYRNA